MHSAGRNSREISFLHTLVHYQIIGFWAFLGLWSRVGQMDKILEISIFLHSFVLSLKMIDTKDVFCYFKLFISQMVIKF